MTSNQRTQTLSSRMLRMIAVAVVGIIALFLLNSARAGSNGDGQIASQSLLTLPFSSEPTATPTALPTTPPLAIPTATPEPTATPLPTPTAIPTATPTPPPTATSAPTPLPATAIPEAAPAATEIPVEIEAATAADVEPAPTAQPVAPEPVAPEPTATFAPTPIPATPTVEPFVAPTAEPTATFVPATPTAVQLQSTSDLELYVLGRINQIRANAGLPAVALDPGISDIARDWSQQMAAGGFFQHRSSDQLSAMLPSGWRQWGENIASAPDIIWAQSSLEQSPGHYENMVGPFTVVGIGVYSQGGQVWVTQNFARY